MWHDPWPDGTTIYSDAIVSVIVRPRPPGLCDRETADRASASSSSTRPVEGSARRHEDLISDDARRIPFRIEIIQSMPHATRSSVDRLVPFMQAAK